MKTLLIVRILLSLSLLKYSCVAKRKRHDNLSSNFRSIPSDFSSNAVLLYEDDYDYENVNRSKRHYNNHRLQTDCGFKCDDGTCIKSSLRCDDFVDCVDVSDETDCKCVDRIGTKKLCDGFEDCPLGEDEKGCGFGCGEGKLSCSDGKTGTSSANCIDRSQRCDGHVDCPNAKDEKDCWRLTSFDLTVRGILPEGTLQKNIGGEWHTVCASSSAGETHWLQKYAKKTCEVIIGQVDEEPKVILTKVSSLVMSVELLVVEPLVFTKFAESDNKFYSVKQCTAGLVYNVECPEPKCGYPASKYDSHATQSHRYARDAWRLTAKIVGGYDSVHGGWPFIVGIFRNGTFHCGASIINKNWILTAAHCTHGYEKYVFEAQAGMTRRNSWSPHEHTRTVKRIYVHERYDSKIFLHDIALMEVAEPFYLSKWVTPACFPSEKSLDPVASQMCKVVGWGDLSEDGDGPDHLQEVDLPILKKCLETFTKDAYQICAGVMEGGKDACQGDSGGPLICEDAIGRHVVNGLVSFGRGCARPNQAGVYTRISSYFSWIESVISGQNQLVSHAPKPRECGTKCFRAGGECMLDKYVCNQEVDCLGQDDELDCNYVGKGRAHEDDDPGESAYEHIRTTSHDTQEHTHAYGSAKLCGPSEFQCKTTMSCIPLHLKCDGKFDCTDSTDEKQCECGDIIENAYPQFKCDGLHHCLDGSDEIDCDSKICNGTKGLVRCAKSNQCIRVSRWCDGTTHCLYGEDEADCIRLIKSRGKLPGEGFLNDKVSRGLQSGYVVIRQSSVKWSAACAEEFGDSMADIVCPYLGMGVLQGTRYRTPSHSRTRRESCSPVKVQCGEAECGRIKLYSMAQDRPPAHYLGSLPWVVVVLAEGSPICAATLVSKHWVLAFASCIDSNVRSTSNEYVSVMAGFSETTTMVMGPMEQTRRVNSLVRYAKEFILLRVETPFIVDHLANPICIDVGSHISHSYCIMVRSSDGQEISEVRVSVDSSCEKDDYNCVLVEDRKECHNATGSFVYCTGGTTWFLLGYVSSLGLSKCSSHGRIQLLNPFYGSEGSVAKAHLTRPPSSIVKAPGCTGTRCTYGNCVANPYVCDGIAHCADNLDERRCQRHYQVLRTYDESTDTPDYGLSSNGTCPEGHFMCKMTLNCVPISAFCDGIYDCGYDDYTDEPLDEDDCTCRHYLELAAPERICDAMGKDHCPDRSDEHYCPCNSDSFACESGVPGSPPKCIHKNLICDYVPDCPDGSDEANCVAVSTSLDKVEMDKSHDKLEGYVLVRVKGSWHPYCSNEWSYDLAEHVCNVIGFGAVSHFTTVELDELESRKDEGEYQAELELLLLGLPNGDSHYSDAGPIEDAVSKVGDEEADYSCTIGFVSCEKTDYA